MLNQILSHYDVTINKFAEEVGQVKQTFYDIKNGKIKSFSPDVAKKITKRFPELNFVWLTTGEGKMFNKNMNSDIIDDKNEEKSAKDIASLKQKIEILQLENQYLKMQIEQYKHSIDLLEKLMNNERVKF